MFNTQVKDVFLSWISNRILRNAVFWLLIGYTVVFNIGMLSSEQLTFKQEVMLFFMHLLVFGPIVYFNNLFLMPKYFEKGLLQKYFLYVGISILGITPYTGLMIDYYTNIQPKDIPVIEFEQLNYGMGVVANSIWVAVFSMIKLGSEYLLDKSRSELLEKEKVQSELDSLKNKLDPHFLFNGLNTIYGLSITDTEKTPDAIMKLSDIMRYVLYDCNDEKVSIEKEMTYINSYIDFGKIRRRNMEDISFKVQGNIAGKTVAPLIFIPFIENAFKHGVDKHIEHPYVKVKVVVEEETITFKCENASYNSGSQEIRKDSGIGIVNVKRRLELLYPKKHDLSIKDENGVYSVNLKLEL